MPETQETPESSAQVSTPADNQSPPSEQSTTVPDVQGPDSAAQTPPETTTPSEGQSSSDVNAQTSSAGQADPSASPPGETEQEWGKRGFKSEEEFYHSADEARSTLGKLYREKAALEKENQQYRDYSAGNLETDDIEKHIASQRTETDRQLEQQDIADERTSLVHKQAKLAIEIFKTQHKGQGREFDEDDINLICKLSTGSQDRDMNRRLDYGFEKFEQFQAKAKRLSANQQQTLMSEKSEVGTGSSTKTETSQLPSFKTNDMDSKDFAEYRRSVLSG